MWATLSGVFTYLVIWGWKLNIMNDTLWRLHSVTFIWWLLDFVLLTPWLAWILAVNFIFFVEGSGWNLCSDSSAGCLAPGCLFPMYISYVVKPKVQKEFTLRFRVSFSLRFPCSQLICQAQLWQIPQAIMASALCHLSCSWAGNTYSHE